MKSIVLFSGGMDSTTLLWSQLPNVKALLVDYGQRHKRELYRAENICKTYEIEYQIAKLEGINHLLQKGSQSGPETPPEGHYTEMSMKTTIVPNRNSIMLSVAVGWAVSTNCDRVSFAAHGGDHTIYPDCREEFVDVFAKAMFLGNAWEPVSVEAPFVKMSKAEICALGAKLGVPFQLTYSCYVGANKHCGKCGTCTERREAFQLAGVKDPTEYE
jgi:7-cyano-7-deazaguanine synthase